MKWKLDNQYYVFQQGNFYFAANPNDLAQGVQVKKGGNVFLRAFFIPDQGLVERQGTAYCRGADIYSCFEGQERVAECYWRLESADPDQVTLEFILSLRSSRLSQEPAHFQVGIQPLQPGFLPIEPLENCFYSQESGLSASIVVHPSDRHEVTLTTTGEAIGLSMTAPQMERGVIRRIRVLLEIKQGPATEQTLAQLETRFSNSPIPLTT